MNTALACRVEPDPAVYEIPIGSWYIVRTAPAFVSELAQAMHDCGVQAYYPQIARKVRVPRTGQRKTVYSPMFPGYVFVPRLQIQHGELDDLSPRVRHRFRFLSLGTRFCELWPGEVERMWEAERRELEAFERANRPKVRPQDVFEIGQRVRHAWDVFPPGVVVGYRNRDVLVKFDRLEMRCPVDTLQAIEG